MALSALLKLVLLLLLLDVLALLVAVAVEYMDAAAVELGGEPFFSGDMLISGLIRSCCSSWGGIGRSPSSAAVAAMFAAAAAAAADSAARCSWSGWAAAAS